MREIDKHCDRTISFDSLSIVHTLAFFVRLERKLLSNIITVIFICTVMITVFMVFQLKGLVNQPPYREQFTFGLLGLEVELGALVPSVINGGMIFVFSAGWKVVSLKLNENENHRTDTQFEDALIAKTFSFEFVNKYAACFYAAFFKKYFVEGDPCDVRPTRNIQFSIVRLCVFHFERCFHLISPSNVYSLTASVSSVCPWPRFFSSASL